MNKILLAIPCFNCDDNIEYVISNISDNALEKIMEVLVIDNGSSDKTRENAKKAIMKRDSNKFQLLLNDKNYGLGGTHKIAIEYAMNKKYDYVGILHGDGQANPKELDEFILEINNANDLTLLGSRFMNMKTITNYSFMRTYGNVLLNWFFSLMLLKKLDDLGSGLNLFHVNSLSKLPVEEFF